MANPHMDRLLDLHFEVLESSQAGQILKPDPELDLDLWSMEAGEPFQRKKRIFAKRWKQKAYSSYRTLPPSGAPTC